jgi:hypothetical protein
MRQANRKFDDFEATENVALGILERLAVLAGWALRQIIQVAINEIDEADQYPRPALRIPRCPQWLGPARGCDGQFEFVLARQRNPCLDRAGCRIEYFAKLPPLPAMGLPSMKFGMVLSTNSGGRSCTVISGWSGLRVGPVIWGNAPAAFRP